MTRVGALIGVVLSIACDPGPLPAVPSRAERADYKKDWFPTNSQGPLPLDRAIQSGNVDAVRRLLEEGADPNARWLDSGDRFPLQEVLEGGQYGYRIDDPMAMVRLLLTHGADPSAKWCPFESRGPSEWSPSCTSAKGMTPLMIASWAGRRDIVEVLLHAGADASARNWLGGSALDYAYDEVVFELISRSLFPDLATRNRKALEWLHHYANRWDGSGGNTPLSRALQGADGPVPPPPQYGTLPSYRAEGEGRILNRVRTLLRIGADPNERTSDGLTPLSIALFARALRAARVLLQNGADVNQRWCERFLPQWAVYRSTPTRLEVAGKDSACTLSNGITPLMWSAAAGDHEPVELLLAFGAERGLQDWAGRTALHYAVTREAWDLLTPVRSP